MTAVSTLSGMEDNEGTAPSGASIEPPVIAEYSPNIEWGRQKVAVMIKQWAYSKTLLVEVGGNCNGFNIMDTAVDMAFEQVLPGDGRCASVELRDAGGNTLLCVDEEDRDERWFRDMVVSVQIVGWTPPTLNEIRKMNGAPPVPHGDQPWNPH